jgi:glycosyltransferase involved in cell wall biosynthesis
MTIHDLLLIESDNRSCQHVESNNPKVSIGMPVYNGEPFILKALDSILAQTFTDFELIISDNASTDGTEKICREYADRDARIRYVRLHENIGAIANFQFVLEEAVGEYFMWAAADDIRSESFLELNLKFLINNNDYVASTSPVRFEGGDFNQVAMGDFALSQDDGYIRMYHFLTKWHANGRFYSLIRRNFLVTFPHKKIDILGADWLWVMYLACSGKMANVNNGYVVLGSSGVSNVTNVFEKYNKNFFLFLFPFWHLTRLTLLMFKNANLILKIKLIVKLLFLNLDALKLNIRWSILARGKISKF